MTRCVTPCIEKRWKSTEPAAFKEARRQAEEVGSVRFTGRTFHSPSDWAFEFEVVEAVDVDHDALVREGRS